jgi:rare lipoprotein A
MASISAADAADPSYARVTNLSNQKSIIVRVNDRGPYHGNRLIDVSVRTARLLGFYENGLTKVRVEYVGRAALEGSDDTRLAATLRQGTPAPGPSEVRIASSRPFLPQAEPVRGAVPIPADRPFELGHEEATGRVAKRQPANEVPRSPARPSRRYRPEQDRRGDRAEQLPSPQSGVRGPG